MTTCIETNEVSTSMVLAISSREFFSSRAAPELQVTAVMESGEDMSTITVLVGLRRDYHIPRRMPREKFARPVQESCKYTSAELVLSDF